MEIRDSPVNVFSQDVDGISAVEEPLSSSASQVLISLVGEATHDTD